VLILAAHVAAIAWLANAQFKSTPSQDACG
jgi:hypothetical protein